jgi:SWI/SNF-related matrix-associated actin-dependent regulator 1 of chromatin subfamily A
MQVQIKDFIKPGLYKILIVDEAHRFKNSKAQRSKATLSLLTYFDRVVFISGTPMLNRPMELYGILDTAAPETIDFMNYFNFGKRYCAGFESKYGWDFSGASNVTELAEKVSPKFMLRIKKEDVLKELPPKTEEVLLIGDDLNAELAALDSEIIKSFSPLDLIKGQISDGKELHLSTYRQKLGIFKVNESAKYIESILENGDEKILVFAIHKQVIAELTEILKVHNPLVITGDTAMASRDQIVHQFQNDPMKRLFVGNIQAAGLGITLTRATRVIFVEFSWTKADNDQAADRAHRIGQTDNVFVQYLCYKNSIDRAVLGAMLEKQSAIDNFDEIAKQKRGNI